MSDWRAERVSSASCYPGPPNVVDAAGVEAEVLEDGLDLTVARVAAAEGQRGVESEVDSLHQRQCLGRRQSAGGRPD